MKPKNESQKTKKNKTQKRKPKYGRVTFRADQQAFFLSGEYATDTIIERFADDQLEYYNIHPDEFHIERYRLMRGVPSSTYASWIERSEYLRNKHSFLQEVIALKRKVRMSDHDPKFLAHTLHTYDKKHDEANKYKARLSKLEEEAKQAPIKIVFDDYKKVDSSAE
jgi:hypothetical protein